MQNSMTEQQAKDVFARQLKELSRQGAAPDSESRLQAIFARSEDACREQETRLATEAALQPASDPPSS